MSTNNPSAAPLFGAAAGAYIAAGWPSVLPLPHAQKTPPPGGYTGRGGAWPTPDQVRQWADEFPDGNLALRLPPDVIGLDVDAYGDKPGADTLQALEDELGPLPATRMSTSRTDGISGIRFYRTPQRPSWHDPGPGIEIIHSGWRYAIAAPSIHDKTGDPYRWIDQATGELVQGAPTPSSLPELPPAWVDRLSSDTDHTKADPDHGRMQTWADQLDDTRPCTVTRNALDEFHRDLRAGGARHDAMLDATGRLVRALERGHHGGQPALAEARAAFLAAVTSDRSRTIPQAEHEWHRAITGAWQLVDATPTPTHERGCRCNTGTAPAVTAIDLPPLATSPEAAPARPSGHQDDGETQRSSWWPVDGTPHLDGTYERPMPTQLARDDGLGLLYPGTTNVIMGESESGKSWIALAAATQAVTRGDTVLFIDFEADPAIIYHRLQLLGNQRDELLDRFRYIIPDQQLGDYTQQDLADTIDLHQPDLVILDGITGAMGLHGLNPLENADAETFDRLLPRRLAATGAAVLQIDHLPQNADEDRRFALGAQHKLAAVSGAAYKFKIVRQFSPGRPGWGRLTISKDRHGAVREQHLTQAGEFHLESSDNEVTFELKAPAQAPADEGKTFRPTTLMERVSQLLEKVDDGLSGRAVRSEVSGSDKGIHLALKQLVEEGHVVQEAGPRGAILHRIERPYRVADDPLAEGGPTVLEDSSGSRPTGSPVPTGSRPVLSGSTGGSASSQASGSSGSPGIHSQGTRNHSRNDPPNHPDEYLCDHCQRPLDNDVHQRCQRTVPM